MLCFDRNFKTFFLCKFITLEVLSAVAFKSAVVVF